MDDLIEQVSEATATSEDGDHLVQIYQSKFIHSTEGLVSAQAASHFLDEGQWSPVVSTCGIADCCRPDHLEEQANQLVAAHAISLADLYRAGRKRGLLTAQSTGYGG